MDLNRIVSGFLMAAIRQLVFERTRMDTRDWHHLDVLGEALAVVRERRFLTSTRKG